jgi:Type ISP C-terminal specificity domain
MMRSELRTDWALDSFAPITGRARNPNTKHAILWRHVYGVLRDPTYREDYGQNLKRDFPLPFYADFGNGPGATAYVGLVN